MVVAAQLAHAQDAVHIVGTARGCVSSERVRERLRELFEAATWPAELRVDLQLEAAQPRFILYRFDEVVAERSFDRLPAACDERRDAVALAVVIAVENYRSARARAAPAAEAATLPAGRAPATEAPPRSAERAPAPQVRAPEAPSQDAPAAQSTPPPTPPAAPARDAQEPPLDTPASARSARTGFTLYAGGSQLWAAAPGATQALTAGIEVAPTPSWSLSAGALWSPRSVHTFAAGPRKLATEIGAVELDGCWSAPTTHVIVQACSGGVAGLQRVEGLGFASNRRVTLGWIAWKLRAAAVWPARGAFALRLHVDGRINLLRPSPRAPDPGGIVDTLALLGGDIGLQILWRFL
jgi:hypothetical protein